MLLVVRFFITQRLAKFAVSIANRTGLSKDIVGRQFEDAMRFEKIGDMDRAALCYEIMLRLQPLHRGAYLALVDVQREKKNHGFVMHLLEEWLKNNSGFVDFEAYSQLIVACAVYGDVGAQESSSMHYCRIAKRLPHCAAI